MQKVGVRTAQGVRIGRGRLGFESNIGFRGVQPLRDARSMTAEKLPPVEQLVPGFEPETDLERAVVADPELRRGLAWGAAIRTSDLRVRTRGRWPRVGCGCDQGRGLDVRWDVAVRAEVVRLA
jgi:hypothetical protein